LRYFIELSYNGKKYHGWQIQPEAITVQGKLNNAISTLFQKKICVIGAGRTDAGVHAKQLFAHFDLDRELQGDYTYKINSLLPKDIIVSRIFLVDDKKHARFDAISRSYQYNILLDKNPFLLDFSWQIHSKLNIKLMNDAAKTLLEYTNFKSFSKVKTGVHTFNCTITKAYWEQNGGQLIFYISANRFLRNMVRAIVGTLVDVGLGKITVADFKNIIESKNRSKAGLSVPAKGLFLTDVKY